MFNILVIAVALFSPCLISALIGCSRVEYITQTVEVHDTLRAISRDTVVHTVREQTVINVRDSISHVEFMRDDTVFVRDYRVINNEIRTEISDSLLKSITDSIAHSLFVENDKETIVPEPTKRKVTLFDRIRNTIGNIAIWTLIVILLYLLSQIAIKHNWISRFINLLKRLR